MEVADYNKKNRGYIVVGLREYLMGFIKEFKITWGR